MKNEKKEISRDALDTVHQGWSEQMEKQELPYTQEWAFLWGKEQKWSFVNINIGGLYQYIQKILKVNRQLKYLNVEFRRVHLSEGVNLK